MHEIVHRFCNDPIRFSVAFAIIILALGLFIHLSGNPFHFVSDFSKKVMPIAIKEMRFKAGRAGIVNISIIFSLTFLSILILFKPSLISIFKEDNSQTVSFIRLLVLIDAICFMISLLLISDLLQVIKLIISKRNLKENN